MKTNELHIVIHGTAGSGKSGIGYAIEQFLQGQGLDATFVDLESGDYNTPERAKLVTESLIRRGTKIVLVEQMAARD